MNLPIDQIEALIFFGEITIGQIGFEVIAVSLGRRGLGESKSQDSILFGVMISASILATILCYIPFYAVTEIPFHSNDNLNKLLNISTLIVTLYLFFCYTILKTILNFLILDQVERFT